MPVLSDGLAILASAECKKRMLALHQQLRNELVEGAHVMIGIFTDDAEGLTERLIQFRQELESKLPYTSCQDGSYEQNVNTARMSRDETCKYVSYERNQELDCKCSYSLKLPFPFHHH